MKPPWHLSVDPTLLLRFTIYMFVPWPVGGCHDRCKTEKRSMNIKLVSTRPNVLTLVLRFSATLHRPFVSAREASTNGSPCHIRAVKAKPCSVPIKRVITWFAPKGMYSATMIDTELRVITSSNSSRILSVFTPDSCARCAFERVGRPPYRRHCGTYADETYETSSVSVMVDFRRYPECSSRGQLCTEDARK